MFAMLAGIQVPQKMSKHVPTVGIQGKECAHAIGRTFCLEDSCLS